MVIGQLAASISEAVFGTAVAGFGFSLGKDVYRGFKKYWQVLVITLAVTGAVILPVLAFSRLLRWYPISWWRWMLTKLLWWLIVSMVGLVLILVSLSLNISLFPDLKNQLPDLSLNTQEQVVGAYSVIVWGVLSLVGFCDGLMRRRSRKLAYELEVYNQTFLNENGIREISGADSYTHVDANAEKLRLTNIGKDTAEFFVVGRRNKRAYLTIGDNGKFVSYSGVVSL